MRRSHHREKNPLRKEDHMNLVKHLYRFPHPMRGEIPTLEKILIRMRGNTLITEDILVRKVLTKEVDTLILEDTQVRKILLMKMEQHMVDMEVTLDMGIMGDLVGILTMV